MFSEFVGHEYSDEIYTFPPVTPRVSIPDVSMSPRGNVSNSVKEWLDDLLSSSKNIEQLAESSLSEIVKGDGESRIREMNAEEREAMENYTELTVSIMFCKRFLKVSYESKLFFVSFLFFYLLNVIAYSLFHVYYFTFLLPVLLAPQTLTGQDEGPIDKIHLQNQLTKGSNEIPQKVIGHLEQLEVQRAEVAPKWWLEWLSLNRPESEVKSGDETTQAPPKDKVD